MTSTREWIRKTAEYQVANAALRETIASIVGRLDVIGRTTAVTDPAVGHLAQEVIDALASLTDTATALRAAIPYVYYVPGGGTRTDAAADDLDLALARARAALTEHTYALDRQRRRAEHAAALAALAAARKEVDPIVAAITQMRGDYDTTTADTPAGIDIRVTLWRKVIELDTAEIIVVRCRRDTGELSAERADRIIEQHERHTEHANTEIARLTQRRNSITE